MIKKIEITEGNPDHVKEYFIYDDRVSAQLVFNRIRKLGFIKSSVIGFVVFKTIGELWFYLRTIFGI